MNRVFLLMAEFQAADIPLEKIAPWCRIDSSQNRSPTLILALS